MTTAFYNHPFTFAVSAAWTWVTIVVVYEWARDNLSLIVIQLDKFYSQSGQQWSTSASWPPFEPAECILIWQPSMQRFRHCSCEDWHRRLVSGWHSLLQLCRLALEIGVRVTVTVTVVKVGTGDWCQGDIHCYSCAGWHWRLVSGWQSLLQLWRLALEIGVRVTFTVTVVQVGTGDWCQGDSHCYSCEGWHWRLVSGWHSLLQLCRLALEIGVRVTVTVTVVKVGTGDWCQGDIHCYSCAGWHWRLVSGWHSLLQLCRLALEIGVRVTVTVTVVKVGTGDWCQGDSHCYSCAGWHWRLVSGWQSLLQLWRLALEIGVRVTFTVTVVQVGTGDWCQGDSHCYSCEGWHWRLVSGWHSLLQLCRLALEIGVRVTVTVTVVKVGTGDWCQGDSHCYSCEGWHWRLVSGWQSLLQLWRLALKIGVRVTVIVTVVKVGTEDWCQCDN